MSRFRFLADVTFEVAGTDQESAISALAGRLAVIARHIGNGAALEDNAPFFILAPGDGEPADIFQDPVREAQIAQEETPPTEEAQS